MQINRLTDIVFSLLKNEKMTAKSLADKFGVTPRTIYRDLEVLSISNVPVYTDKGKGGGIFITEEYRLNNAVLSNHEQQELLALLSANNAVINSEGTNKLLDKLSSIFRVNNDYIEVDFSDWKNDDSAQIKFELIKSAIINKNVLQFNYYNINGEENIRIVEPLKLVYKHRSWYMYSYCRVRQENRLFRLSRMSELKQSTEKFERVCTENNIAKSINWKCDNVELIMKVDKSLKSRVYDEMGKERVEILEDGNFLIKNTVPLDEWIISYLLSYGDKMEILSPQYLHDKIRDIHISAGKK